jgi:hypothetical protein
MKKIYFLLFACFGITWVNAQINSGLAQKMQAKRVRKPINNGLPAAGCDTLNLAVLNDSAVLYTLDGSGVGTGFFTGVNSLGNLGNAQFFDASALSDNYVNQAYIYFGVASSKTVTKAVPVDVFDGTGGSVGALLGTTTLTMGSIMSDVQGNYFSQVVFNPAIQLPASKLFFVGVDYSNLSNSPSQFDSLAIVTTLFGQATNAWEYDNDPSFFYQNGWTSDYYDWGQYVGLYIFPLLSVTPICETTLPVQLTSFTAQTKGTDVLLNWQVAQELNMKEYNVERSSSNFQFTSVGTVAATNSALQHAYSFTDVGALNAVAGDIFYRLKQVNSDGSITYSNVIRVNVGNGTFSAKIVNPFSNTVQMHISSPVAQKMQAAIYDVQGRKVASLSPRDLSAGDNYIAMPTGQLPQGIYILNLTAGGTVYKYKILSR